jgi:imidazole glycerol-phosphate synthase subunit HisH
MIAVIDYGAGNIRSVAKAVEALGAECFIAENYSDLKKADKVILPGVGAFGKAARTLESGQMKSGIIKFIETGRPFLGICLGFQLLFESSEEDPGITGLNLIRGKSTRLTGSVKIPHLGWNRVKITENHPLWKNIPDESFFYFAHSYMVIPEEKFNIGETEYGCNFASAIAKDNIIGLQFHPEKSQNNGLKILKNFIEM